MTPAGHSTLRARVVPVLRPKEADLITSKSVKTGSTEPKPPLFQWADMQPIGKIPSPQG